MITDAKFWDLGEEELISPSKKNLYNIMNALILCKGKLHCSYSIEAKNGEWTHSTRVCTVIFKISLPIDTEKKFEELSGFKLSEPAKFVGF